MSIEVRVKLFGTGNSSYRRISLEEDACNLRSLLQTLATQKAAEYIRGGCVVSVNKELITDDVVLGDKDEITIMPMLHGG